MLEVIKGGRKKNLNLQGRGNAPYEGGGGKTNSSKTLPYLGLSLTVRKPRMNLRSADLFNNRLRF